MSIMSLTFITAVSAIVLASCSKDLERLPIKSSISPEFYMFRPKNFQCLDENCFEERIQKTQKFITRHNESPVIGQDYDWAKTNINEIENELMQKRGDSSDEYMYIQDQGACSCQTKYELYDLGLNHFPRYLMNAVCQNRNGNNHCCRGSTCKEIPYKVRVLTHRSANDQDQDRSPALPPALETNWKLKTVTVAAACQCAV